MKKNTEIKLIAEYRTTNRRYGYNTSPGGDATSEETKMKISLASMGNKKWLGKHHKEETKQKMSQIMKEHYANYEFTDEDHKALSKRAKQAYIDHPELRQQLSESRKRYFKEHPEAIELLSIKRTEYYKNHPEAREKLAKDHEKPVDMFDKDGFFIKTFESLTKAMNETGTDRSSIARTCAGEQHTAGGYIWSYHIKN